MTDRLRITRRVPGTDEETTLAVLEDLESLEEGLRIFARRIPLPGRGEIDALAVDGRGRCALLLCAARLEPSVIARGLEQWVWLTGNLPTLMAFGGAGLSEGTDLSAEPRLLIASGEAPEQGLRFAALLPRPKIELFRVAVVSDGERSGLLVEPLAAAPSPAGPPPRLEERLDPALASLPSGASRSLMRRMIEELREAEVQGSPVRALAVEAGVDLVAGERPIGSLRAGHSGVRVRRFEEADEREVQDDAGCREAVAFLLGHQEPEPDETSESAGEQIIPSAVSLTPEEIAEFRRFDRKSPERPDIGAPPRKFVEN